MPIPPPHRQQPGRWFGEGPGARLVRDEQRAALPWVARVFGPQGLYLRPSDAAPPQLSGNMLGCVMHAHRAPDGFDGDLRWCDAVLPLASDSVSLVYAQHVLETSAAPRALVSEWARVLVPGGHGLLFVLNRASLWRLSWAGAGLQVPRLRTLRGWLADEGLALEQQFGLGARLPAYAQRVDASDVVSRGSGWRPGLLLIVRKQRLGLRPVARRAPVAALVGTG